MYVHDEKKIGDYLIKIFHDEDPESPRAWDNLGIMVCSHKRDSYGDKHDFRFDDYNSWEEMEKDIMDNHDGHTILPIYMYEHSGVTISTTPFMDYFDSGRLGLIYCTKQAVAKEGIDDERVVEILKGEVDTYDTYVKGEVYGYRIYKVSTCSEGHEHEEELDSCYGYFNEDQCMGEAEGMVEHYQAVKS